MKKLSVLTVVALLVVVLSNCGPSKKSTTDGSGTNNVEPPPPPKMTYAANLQAVISEKCAPCHIPGKGGNKKPFDNFANVKADIDEMLRRIQLNPGERGFMPMGRPPVKLSDAEINIFKQWKADGMLEN